ncbi:hypothetical protein ITP53_54925 [Nonomuraea sp. K274]|uniref:Uncharacterized protein n=1 Tax=Nonomuraea cypriaca TaxID=1187855 RepID=A0A931AQJ0_9ACTN|nr:hypothetical protein [Nonomuraea cypriaca]MBF8194605.1 hypothetical protein [Nonomuraea cypriaca]
MPTLTLTLTEDSINDLRDLLDRVQTVEDWLLHAPHDVIDELADFAFHSHFHPRSAVAWLTEDLGNLNCRLRKLLPEPRAD